MKRVLLLSIFLLATISINAQGWGQTQKIVPADRAQSDNFGYAVAMSGDYTVVGAYRDDLTSSTMGSAYVYKKDTNGNWIAHQKLTAPDKRQSDQFGKSVAMDGDYLIIGAIGQDYDLNNSNFIGAAGAIYIYEKDTNENWNFVQKLIASDRETLNAFGDSVAINGNYAIVSPIRHDFDASGNNFLDDAGAVYILERDGNGTWSEVQKIVASDRAALDYFGQNALSVSGNYIVVGSLGDDEDENGANTLSSTGSAYIFERDGSGTWNEIQKIVNSDRELGDTFGRSVGIDGNYLVVGADYEDTNGNASGSAYIFEKDINNNWNEVQKLTTANGIAGDRFGTAIDIEGDRIIIGAHFKDIGSPGDDGAAYIFENESGVWTETAFIYDAFNSTSEYFGFSVAISGDYALAGSYQDSEDENEENFVSTAGAAFIFDVNEPNTLSIIENSFSSILRAYPNPTQDKVHLDLKTMYETVELEVLNVLGQVIINQTYNETSQINLNLKNVENGLYLMNLKTNTTFLQTIKIIKD